MELKITIENLKKLVESRKCTISAILFMCEAFKANGDREYERNIFKSNVSYTNLYYDEATINNNIKLLKSVGILKENKKLLRFVNTGDISINVTNVCDLISPKSQKYKNRYHTKEVKLIVETIYQLYMNPNFNINKYKNMYTDNIMNNYFNMIYDNNIIKRIEFNNVINPKYVKFLNHNNISFYHKKEEVC